MSDLQSELREHIRRTGHRLTPQRQIILDAVRELTGHCTPDAVYTQVQTKNTAINRATVYRTLDFLLKQGFLTKAHLQDNLIVYELASAAPHHHLICQQCDRALEIEHEAVQPFFSGLYKRYDFQVRTNHLVLFGICKNCQRETKYTAVPK